MFHIDIAKGEKSSSVTAGARLAIAQMLNKPLRDRYVS